MGLCPQDKQVEKYDEEFGGGVGMDSAEVDLRETLPEMLTNPMRSIKIPKNSFSIYLDGKDMANSKLVFGGVQPAHNHLKFKYYDIVRKDDLKNAFEF